MIVDPLTCFSYWLLIYLIYEEKLAENFSCQAATPFTRLSARCWMLDTTIIHCRAKSLNRGQICWGSDVPSSFSLYISPKYCYDRCIDILRAKYCSCIYYMRRRDGGTGAEGGWGGIHAASGAHTVPPLPEKLSLKGISPYSAHCNYDILEFVENRLHKIF